MKMYISSETPYFCESYSVFLLQMKIYLNTNENQVSNQFRLVVTSECNSLSFQSNQAVEANNTLYYIVGGEA